MGVLAAVLPHAGDVAFDVAGIQVGFVERRVEQLDQPVLAANQVLVHRVHGHARRARDRRRRRAPTSFAGWNRSGIRDCSPSRAACRRRSRRGDTTRRPSRAPRCSGAAARPPCRSVRRRTDRRAASASSANCIEHVVQEKAQPDAFAPALLAHQVHAVVPVAGADERQAVLAESQALRMARTQCSYRLAVSSDAVGKIVIGILVGFDRAAFEEVDRSSSTPVSPVLENVAARRQGQPEVIVGTVRAHAAARRRMPPMLDISLRKLAGRAEEQVLAHEARLGVDERHHVLQLVAEAEGAAGLVKAAPRPETAGQSLVQEPAVGQHVEGRVGRFHLHRAEGVVPILPDRLERRSRRDGATEAPDQVCSHRRRLAPRRA